MPYAEKQMDQEERKMIIERHNNMPRMQKYRDQFFQDLQKLESEK